jgi:DNA-directed RNA polymerase subunit RPC12/RpoP
MVENQERCLKCGKQQGLQGVAVTIGRRTFHLFYLCSKCGNVNIEELLRIIGYIKKRKQLD